MNNHVIQEWEASYYCWDDKIWKYGKLVICLDCIRFFEKNSKAEKKPMISLDLSQVTGFQRKLVSLVFKAVVVLIKDLKPQWFSSLLNREETFYFLEHFWQQRLLLGLGYSRAKDHQKNQGAGTASTLNDTERRQKLFEVLYDSESTLTKAADSLYNQGEQLDYASHKMNLMHKDLTVAETLINGLDRWFTKWNIRPEYLHEINLKKEYPVLYRKQVKESFSPAILVMTGDQISVLSTKRVAIVTMLLKDFTSIMLNTPWNVVLVKSVIGEPDLMVDISSAHVVYIVKALQREHGNKFQYEEPSIHTNWTVKNRAGNSAAYQKSQDLATSTGLDEGDDYIPSQTVSLHVGVHKQAQQRVSGLDEADFEDVCGVVNNMKSLAIGIGQEMSRQLDRVDQLSESVDKADYRLNRDSRKLRDKL